MEIWIFLLNFNIRDFSVFKKNENILGFFANHWDCPEEEDFYSTVNFPCCLYQKLTSG